MSTDKGMVSEQALRIGWQSNLEQDKELFQELQAANKILGQELGRRQTSATADWERGRDAAGREHLQLTLTDLLTGNRVVAHYRREELKNPKHLEMRIRRLWGDLLEMRSHKQLEQLEAASGAKAQA